jgi:hypothetical protein
MEVVRSRFKHRSCSKTGLKKREEVKAFKHSVELCSLLGLI